METNLGQRMKELGGGRGRWAEGYSRRRDLGVEEVREAVEGVGALR